MGEQTNVRNARENRRGERSDERSHEILHVITYTKTVKDKEWERREVIRRVELTSHGQKTEENEESEKTQIDQRSKRGRILKIRT